MTDICDKICSFPKQAQGFKYKDVPLSIVIDIVKNENWYKEDDENYGSRNISIRKFFNERIDNELQALLDKPEDIIIWWGSHYGKKLGQLDISYFKYVKNNPKMMTDEDCETNQITNAMRDYMYNKIV